MYRSGGGEAGSGSENLQYGYLGTTVNRITKAIIACLVFYRVKTSQYIATIKSVMLNGCKMWRITQTSRRTSEATEMDAIRQSMKISPREKIRNQATDGSITDDMKRELIWCKEWTRLPKHMMEWMLLGKRRRETPTTTWIGQERKTF